MGEGCGSPVDLFLSASREIGLVIVLRAGGSVDAIRWSVYEGFRWGRLIELFVMSRMGDGGAL